MARRPTRRSPGDGSITELAPGKFKAHFPIGRGRYRTKVHDSRKSAQAWLDEQKRLARAGVQVTPGRQPFAEWMQRCLDRWAARSKAKTAADYAYKIGFALPHLGSIALADLTYDAIEACLTALLTSGLAWETVNQVRGHINRALEEACKRRYIEFNACPKEMPRPRPPRREPLRLSLTEAARLICAADGTDFALILWLFLGLGLREGEVIGLRLGDVAGDTLTIAQQITVVENRPHVETPKSDDGRRTLPLPPDIAAALEAHKTALVKRAARSEAWRHHGLLFPSRRGTPRGASRFDRQIKELLVAAGLPRSMHVHDLRHTAAAFYTAVGAPEVVRAAIAGHKPRSITDYYGAPADDALRPWVEQVFARLRVEVARAAA